MSEKKINKRIVKRYDKNNPPEDVLVKVIKKYIEKRRKKSDVPKG